MAMSETMSAPNDWFQFYEQNFSTGNLVPGVSDATAITTIAVASPLTPATANSNSSSAAHLSPEGRISKPIRRRTRASRRTPTTLLNTDTTNFRAMVQQFTGGPSAHFVGGPSNLGFGFGSRQAHDHPNPTGPVTVPTAGRAYHFQQQQPQQVYQQQSQQLMFSLNNSSNVNSDTLFQRLSSNPSGEVSNHGFEMDEGGGRFFPNTSG